MISTETITALLFAGLAALVASGFAVVVWGEKLPRRGDWAVGIPLAYLLVVFGVAWNALSDDHFAVRVWSRGWIWPHDQPGAITVGVLFDPLGITLAALTALIAGLFLVDLRERSPKNFGAIAFSAAGGMLSWTALTPWTVFCGMALSILGGILSLGTLWGDPGESVLAARFGWERSWGLLLAIFGLCVLAGSRGALSFASSNSEWMAQAASSADPFPDLLGLSLLLFGLFVQLQPFPFFSGLVADSKQPAPVRLFLRQILPGWCAFALLLRVEPYLESAGPFFKIEWQVLGGVGFASAALAVASGLVQRGWKSPLSLWVSSAFGLCVGALSFAGPRAATAVLIGAGLGALVLAEAGDALEGEEKKSGKDKEGANPARGLKAAAAFGAASATGMIGFLSARGALDVLVASADQPIVLAAGTLVLFLSALLCWSIVWKIVRFTRLARVPWVSVAVTSVLVILSLGVLWTGSASGGAIGDGADTVFGSLFSILFGGAEHATAPDPAAFVTASGLHWGALVVGALVSFWVSGSKESAKQNSIATRFPGFAAFLASGYGVDRAVAAVRGVLVRAAEAIERTLNQRLWKTWLPAIFSRVVHVPANLAMIVDEKIAEGLGVAIRRSVETPAKALQLIQNGDVRWYLFFAVGSGFLILLHFARVFG